MHPHIDCTPLQYSPSVHLFLYHVFIWLGYTFSNNSINWCRADWFFKGSRLSADLIFSSSSAAGFQILIRYLYKQDISRGVPWKASMLMTCLDQILGKPAFLYSDVDTLVSDFSAHERYQIDLSTESFIYPQNMYSMSRSSASFPSLSW